MENKKDLKENRSSGKPKTQNNTDKIIGSCTLMRECRNKAVRMANSEAPVLITGASGTGKELFANLIYTHSKRNTRPYVKVNCASLPESLIETELFGHVKGAFTDAGHDRKGKFLSADTGTVFLDEICELPLSVQSRLLHVLESGSVEQIGSDLPVKVDIRIITATNRDIEEEIQKGNFRKDLFYRLNVLALHLPTLADRRSDIGELVSHFTGIYGNKISFDSEAISKLSLYEWPGNVRELKNYVQRLSVIYQGRKITSDDIDIEIIDKNIIIPLKNAINNFKKKYIMEALSANSWNQSRTSSALGIQRTYLSRLLKELDIRDNTKE